MFRGNHQDEEKAEGMNPSREGRLPGYFTIRRSAGSIVPQDIQHQGVLSFAQLFQGIDQFPHLVFRVLEIVCEVFGEAREQPFFLRGEGIPSGYFHRPLRELGPCGNDPQFQLPPMGLIPVFVPAQVEAATMAAPPIRRGLMGGMRGHGSEIREEGPHGRDGLLPQMENNM
jgi:hypothetical protein